ncbi:C10 family peptidase [Kiritimatiella glycovorans]|uniref:Peptidase C10 family n=1 Tax=Kiritimatiella glycovorans TaxID=1307763 RepID=A0A0G3EC38_9BACT|nr:C10 family peptidase [Kiritimatiella glycovorans]AKJ64061.1 Peptidase C10 family [Kiritimatiella glycovorans]
MKRVREHSLRRARRGSGMRTATMVPGLIAAALFLACGTRAPAAAVSRTDATRAAAQWLAKSLVFARAESRMPSGVLFSIRTVEPLALGGQGTPTAWHADLDPRGYLVLGADDRMPPILCFSAENDLNLADDPRNALRAMLERDLSRARMTLDGLDRAGGNQLRIAGASDFVSENRARWDAWLSEETAYDGMLLDAEYQQTGILVDAMLSTTWDQCNHYNEGCPEDPAASAYYDGKAPAGCVAVAGAQIMNFYEWPSRGREAHTYTDRAGSITGVFSAVFSDVYAWSAMQNDYDPWSSEAAAAVEAVSELMYELGVAVEMDYEHDGSAAYSGDLVGRAESHFFYERATPMDRDEDPGGFDGLLRDEMLAGRPCPASIPGHAFVVDGLSEESGADYFHINYGWGGTNDGWYEPSNINGSSFQTAYYGMRPQFRPLLDSPDAGTNTTGHVELRWSFPACSAAAVTGYRLKQAAYAPSALFEAADDFSRWETSGGWELDTPGVDGTGSCFHRPSDPGRAALTLADPLIPSGSTKLSFDYKTILSDDSFYVKVSSDRGQSWDTLMNRSGTGWDDYWLHSDLDLSMYAGKELWVRFQYVREGGDSFYTSGGVWLDQIEINDFEGLEWRLLDDAIPSSQTNVLVTCVEDDLYYHALEAHNGTNWQRRSPPVGVEVALSATGDVDGDGLPNGWELTYSGTATGRVATADGDKDRYTDLEEYYAGTDPEESSSYFRVRRCAADSGVPELTWASVSGRTYRVMRTEGLQPPHTFSVRADDLPATPRTNRYTDTGATGCGPYFYRVEIYME